MEGDPRPSKDTAKKQKKKKKKKKRRTPVLEAAAVVSIEESHQKSAKQPNPPNQPQPTNHASIKEPRGDRRSAKRPKITLGASSVPQNKPSTPSRKTGIKVKEHTQDPRSAQHGPDDEQTDAKSSQNIASHDPSDEPNARSSSELQNSAGKVATKRRAPTRKKKQKKGKKPKGLAPAPAVLDYDAEAAGTLSDRLNPTHPCFDAALKAKWKEMPKRERKAIVAADAARLSGLRQVGLSLRDNYPFEADDDDHCETSPEAWKDIAPVLSWLAGRIGVSKEALSLYEPYYCAGGSVRNLAQAGFPNVYNKCEDFYAVVEAGRVPQHDVLVTNPPYSADHVRRLLDFVTSNGKPAALLMPSYVCGKEYFPKQPKGEYLFLCPPQRYFYWTPKGFRVKKQNHSSALGNRTSPFVSFWYLQLGKLRKEFMRWWKDHAVPGMVLASSVEALPYVFRPSASKR